MRIETGAVRAGTPFLAFREHSRWAAVGGGIGHAKVEVIGRVEEVDVCVVDLGICAKTCCVDENSRNLVCGPSSS